MCAPPAENFSPNFSNAGADVGKPRVVHPLFEITVVMRWAGTWLDACQANQEIDARFFFAANRDRDC
jgi:hypothetical protein